MTLRVRSIISRRNGIEEGHPNMTTENRGDEQVGSEGQVGDEEARELGDRIRGAGRSISESVARSADVLTGGDIRKFQEFTDAATTAIVGIHQDQTELRERLERLEETVASRRGFNLVAQLTPLNFLIGGTAVAALILSTVALVMVAS